MRQIPISSLIPHPANPNVMSESNFRKLVRNIQRSGLYEPIVVRPHPKEKDCFQIINGHHRVKALEKLGRCQADCVVWNVDDEQTAVFLATLNRLGGTDSPAKKIALLRELTEQMASKDLAKLLPQTAKQIEQLINFKMNVSSPVLQNEQFLVPLVFFVTKQQQDIIEQAISLAAESPVPASSRYGGRCSKREVKDKNTTRPHRRATALTEIVNQFLRTCPP
jgi:ParB/RepB/Spo0J family partition protein